MTLKLTFYALLCFSSPVYRLVESRTICSIIISTVAVEYSQHAHYLIILILCHCSSMNKHTLVTIKQMPNAYW